MAVLKNPAHTSALGMTLSATHDSFINQKDTIAQTIENGIGSDIGMTGFGPLLYATSLTGSILGHIFPKIKLNPFAKPERISYVMAAGATCNLFENIASFIQAPSAILASWGLYWSLATYVHIRMAIFDKNCKKPTIKDDSPLLTTALFPGNVFIPMNATLACIPLFIAGGTPITIGAAAISLGVCALGALYQYKQNKRYQSGDIAINQINDGRVNELNIGVCFTNAIAFGLAGAPIMALSMTAFLATNLLFRNMLKGNRAPKPLKPTTFSLS